MTEYLNISGLTNKSIFKVDFKEPYTESIIKDETTQNIRAITYSPKGNYFSYRTDRKVEVLQSVDYSVVATIERNVKDMIFSPLDTYFATWELFVIKKDKPECEHNLNIYKSATGERIGCCTQSNQTGWEPQWSSDERICFLKGRSAILIYENGDFTQYKNSIPTNAYKSFSVSPSPAPSHYFCLFTLGTSGQPSFWRMYKYPDTKIDNSILSRSSFQADKATFYWNRRGTNVFVITQSDVDKTGGSYYGKQSLSYGDVKGSSGNMIFSKEGPIHALSWNPGNWNEWVAVYGHAPAKATLFNAKCESLFEFGTGPWNSIYFAPDGNYVLFGGFGNIATGQIEVWDVRGYKKLGSCAAPDSTYLQWDPRGETFLTATTYPRLTVSNGYKIWHYTGVLIYKRECQEKEHLLSICWRPGTYVKSELSKIVPKGIEDTTPKKAGAYRPPGAKNRPSNFTLHEHEKPHRPGENPNTGPSKQAIKQKEKREARKARKAEERATGDTSPAPVAPSANRLPFISTGDPDKDKKIKNLNKKLSDIDKLKQQKAAGKQLELNQLAKIDNELALLTELEQLRL